MLADFNNHNPVELGQEHLFYFFFLSCHFSPLLNHRIRQWQTGLHTHRYIHAHKDSHQHTWTLCAFERGFRAVKPVLHKINRADQRRSDPPLPQTEGRTSERWPKGRQFRHHKPKCLWKCSDLNMEEACFSFVFRKEKK